MFVCLFVVCRGCVVSKSGVRDVLRICDVLEGFFSPFSLPR